MGKKTAAFVYLLISAVLTELIRWLMRLIEDSAVSWINHSIAHALGIISPTTEQLLGYFISGGVPAILAFSIVAAAFYFGKIYKEDPEKSTPPLQIHETPASISDGSDECIEKYVDNSIPFLTDKLGDLSALIQHGCLTLGQCALLVPAMRHSGKSGDASEMADHFVRLALLDVAHGELLVKHPKTLLPYSEYLRMASAGIFGQDRKGMPLADASWLVPLEDAEQWFEQKGVAVNLDGVKDELKKLSAKGDLPATSAYLTPCEVIQYMAFKSAWGAWVKFELTKEGVLKNALQEAPAEFQTGASEGRVRVYGIPDGSGTHAEIPKTYWMSASLSVMSCYEPDAESKTDATTMAGGYHGIVIYRDLKIETSDVFEVWPPA